MGCLRGCLDYLGLDITDAWLYGGTGHAFVINIHPESCPSGPTAWDTKMLCELAPNLGYRTDSVVGFKGEAFAQTQQKAWNFTRKSIDEGLPVYGWELEVAEFYVVYGYDEVGYYFSGAGADEGKGPKPWQELGDTGIGVVEMYAVSPVPAKEPAVVVKETFQKVLEHASNPPDQIFENYASGLKGYDLWIKGLEAGKAGRFGMGYNAAVWAECRGFAVAFLEEASQRMGSQATPLFEEALDHYREVAQNLEAVSNVYPFEAMDETIVVEPDADCQKAVGYLRAAREAESGGQAVLEKIAAML
jgi:hypothetical protein